MTPRELAVGIELSAYRIVQEALTNALKHAGQARAAVHLRYGLTAWSWKSSMTAPEPSQRSPAAATAWSACASGSPCTGASSTRPAVPAAASPSACDCR